MTNDEAIAKIKGVSGILSMCGEQKDPAITNMDFGFGLMASDLREAAEVLEKYILQI